jgi:cyclic beta-1,2-glucan synthetase
MAWHTLPNGSVRFAADGNNPPYAWCHSLHGGGLGAVVCECGPLHTWFGNARENALTGWKGDPLSRDSDESLALVSGGRSVSLFAGADGPVDVTYGFGFAEWEKQTHGMKTRVTAFIPPDTPARVMIVRCENHAPDTAIQWKVRLQMGPNEAHCIHVTGHYDPNTGAYTAANPYNTEYPGQVITLGSYPAATGADTGVTLAIPFDHEGTAVLVFGTAPHDLCQPGNAVRALEETKAYWAKATALTVETPDAELNHYLNGWAVYQTLCCRILGRSSVWQCGGAYGFRDQLQDACGLLLVDSEPLREGLLRAAAHQFLEGDVMHWWHPPGTSGRMHIKGVRTRCSDDLVFLPYCLCEYLDKTGDLSILDAGVPYLSAPLLEPDQHERYSLADIDTSAAEPLYQHAVRALNLTLERGVGVHGLPLMGTGDWNDGMNRVGAEGRGESVWLGWFLAHTLERFAPIVARRGDNDLAAQYCKQAERLLAACREAWDGGWYRRGYFDDGSPLGSASSMECQIDSLAQSFAALCGDGRAREAVDAAVARLHDKGRKIIKLFDPPFMNSDPNPGYIQGYLPGVRENGAQYTHAAVWLALGCLLAGKPDDGYAILRDLLPATHDPAVYQLEPYVLAADVYTAKGLEGRGGWSWYTGAAGWYFRVAAEAMLGIKLNGGAITLEPRLPSHWEGYKAALRRGDTVYRIEVTNNGRDHFIEKT